MMMNNASNLSSRQRQLLFCLNFLHKKFLFIMFDEAFGILKIAFTKLKKAINDYQDSKIIYWDKS